MKETMISVIIPAYNTEQYLSECLDSVLNQSYKKLEVIIVDDGSTDKTPKICDQYAQKDTRVKVLHIQNGGVSNARNTALESATGDVICFVDSDDIINSKMCENMLKVLLISNSDVVFCRYRTFIDKLDINECNLNKNYQVVGKDDAISSLINDDYAPVIWNKMFRRNVIYKKNCVKFNEDIIIGEDELWLIEVLAKANKIALMQDVFYYWRNRESSALHDKKKSARKNEIKAQCIILNLLDIISPSNKPIYESYFYKLLFMDRKYMPLTEVLDNGKTLKENLTSYRWTYFRYSGDSLKHRLVCIFRDIFKF